MLGSMRTLAYHSFRLREGFGTKPPRAAHPGQGCSLFGLNRRGMSGELPYPDSDDDSIAPDVAPRDERPIDPAEAVRREQQKYGESSLDENRDDQWDEHHGTPDDIV